MSNFIYKYGIASIFMLLLCACLFTVISLKVFGLLGDVPDIPAGTVAAFSTMFGLPAIVIGFYRWRNEQDIKKRDAANAN